MGQVSQRPALVRGSALEPARRPPGRGVLHSDRCDYVRRFLPGIGGGESVGGAYGLRPTAHRRLSHRHVNSHVRPISTVAGLRECARRDSAHVAQRSRRVRLLHHHWHLGCRHRRLADCRLTLCHAFTGTRGNCNFFRLRSSADPASIRARRLRREAVQTPGRLHSEYGYSTARVLSVSPDSVPGRACTHGASTDNAMDWKLVSRSADGKLLHDNQSANFATNSANQYRRHRRANPYFKSVWHSAFDRQRRAHRKGQ